MYNKKDLKRALTEVKAFETLIEQSYKIYNNKSYEEKKETGFKNERQEERYNRKNQTYNLLMKDYISEVFYFSIICEEWATSYRKNAVDTLHDLRIKIGRLTDNADINFYEIKDICYDVQYEVGLC